MENTLRNADPGTNELMTESLQHAALSIDHVLSTILHFTITGTGRSTKKRKDGTQLILKIRLVSQKWNLIASEIIRYSHVLARQRFKHSSELSRFSKIMKYNVNPIYSKFHISGRAMDDLKSCYKFFRNCGWFITDLEIDFGYGLLNKPILFNEKQLETLKLKLERLCYNYSTPSSPIKESDEVQVNTLFSSIINASSATLKYLKCRFYVDNAYHFYNHLKLPPKILTNPELPWNSLEKVELGIMLTDVFLHDLSNSTMKPRELTFHVQKLESTYTLDKLTEYFASQSSTLVKLNLIEQSCRYIIKFPQKMTALRSIQFNDVYGPTPYIRFESFDYETHLPALDTVKLPTASKEDSWLSFFSSKSTTMKQITLPIVAFTNLDLARKLYYNFPNLIALGIGLLPTLKHQFILEAVFSTLTKLKTLKIYGVLREDQVWIDHILTGYSKEDCRQMRRERLFLNTEIMQSIPRKPSLVDLTQLENFELTRQPPLDFLRESTPYSVSDVTGYSVFLRMPNLKKIKIINRGLTETCLNLLKTKMYVETEAIQGYNSATSKRELIDRTYNYDDYDSPTPPTHLRCFQEGDD